MSVYRNIPIARKFMLAFGLVCTLCVSLGTYSFFAFLAVSKASEDVSENGFPSVIQLANARGAFNQLGRADLNLLLCQAATCSVQYGSLRTKAIDDYQTAIKAYEGSIVYPGEREIFQRLTTAEARYREISDKTAALLAEHKTGDALDMLTSASAVAAFDDARTALTEDMDLNAKFGMESSRHTTATSHRAIWINASVTILIVILSALIGAGLTRVIAPRIGRAMGALQQLAAKDLTAHLNVSGSDEIGQLGEALQPLRRYSPRDGFLGREGCRNTFGCDHGDQRPFGADRRQRQHPVKSHQPDRSRGPGDDRDHWRDQS